jgi:TonB family protein
VFRIDAPTDEARCEPRLEIEGEAAPHRLRWQPPEPALNETPADAAETKERLRRPLPGSSPPPTDETPISSPQRSWRAGPIASLVLHLLPLLLLLDWPMRPPAEVKPIPVQLVFQPPPPPPPAPKPAPRPRLRAQTRPPPPGRIASVDMGEVQKKGSDEAKSEAPTSRKEPAATTESPLEAPQQTAMLPPPPPLPEPPNLDFPKPPEPRPVAVPKPPQKPSMAARLPVRRAPQWARLAPRAARYPGPAATRDEYLAYLAYLARQHIGLLSPSLISGRRGETIINVLVLDDGTVAMLSVGLSSGYPDIDERIEQMIRAVGRFPPLPQWFQGQSMRLEFRLQFPEALEG